MRRATINAAAREQVKETEQKARLDAESRILPLCAKAKAAEEEYLQMQIKKAQFYERFRWACALGMPGKNANDVPFPCLDECSPRSSLGPLLPWFCEQGTWHVAELSPSSVQELVALRRSMPRQCGKPPEHRVSADYKVERSDTNLHASSELRTWKTGALSRKAREVGATNEEVDVALDEDDITTALANLILCKQVGDSAGSNIGEFERAEWLRIAATKDAERNMWGCFDAAQFPVFSNKLQVDGPDGWQAPWILSADHAQFVEATDPLLLRSEVHADDVQLDTTIDGASAWEMKPLVMLPQIPKDVWETSAAGGFCLRISEEQKMAAATPVAAWQCVICLDEDPADAVLTTCAHTFHSKCISRWFQRSTRCPLCRFRCRTCLHQNPPMDFDLTPWNMLPAAVIAQDEVLPAQELVATQRAQKPLSLEACIDRRMQLAVRFNCEPPGVTFFQEVHPNDESAIGPAAVITRAKRFREEAAAKRASLEALGEQLTIWPVGRRWPAVVLTNPRIVKRRASLAAHFARSARTSNLHGFCCVSAPPSSQEIAQELLNFSHDASGDQSLSTILPVSEAEKPLQQVANAAYHARPSVGPPLLQFPPSCCKVDS
jgi:hypothetical protein